MARIGGVNIANHQHAEVALTAIYGIGRSRARLICTAAGINTATKIKDLSDTDMEKLREQVAKFTTEGDLRREISMNIKRLMDLGTWRGRLRAATVSRAHASRPLSPPRSLPKRPVVLHRNAV